MSANLTNNNVTMSNDLTNKVVRNINVFCLLMEYLIFRETYDTLTITKECGGLQITKNFTKQASKPNSFLTSFYNIHIFCHGSRQCNCNMQSSFPTDSTTYNSKHILSKRYSFIKISCKTRINVPNNTISRPPKMQTNIRRTMQVLEYPLNYLLVFLDVVPHIPANNTNNI